MALKTRQKLGKYRIERRLDRGGFADVYRARDTIEGIQVALKIPHGHLISQEILDDFRREVRLTARLDHPHILPIKNAGFIEGRFVIAYPLGICSLADRLQKRLSLKTALFFGEQMLEALAYAHHQRIVHCDVKPENLIVFSEDYLRLTDFGIAKLALRTLRASGAGTVGYVAPEQAMGHPSFRSDVFSAGLVLYRMLSGDLPEWPYAWPFPGYERVRRKVHPDMLSLIRRATQLEPRQRFPDAVKLRDAFLRLKKRTLAYGKGRPSARRPARSANAAHWKTVRRRQFLRRFGAALATRHECSRCHGPVSENMAFCPWCATARRTHRDESRMPAQCPRCKRGVKLDWRFCAWCYGGSIGPQADREFSDVHYEARCTNARCQRRDLMPFMRYCPWCNTKVRRKWKVPESPHRCRRCGWGVVPEFWEHCPWCQCALGRTRS